LDDISVTNDPLPLVTLKRELLLIEVTTLPAVRKGDAKTISTGDGRRSVAVLKFDTGDILE
jgi:hypothetical protein